MMISFAAFSTFLNLDKKRNAVCTLQEYISQLQKIFNIISQQTSLHLYSSSILLIYDCAQLGSNVILNVESRLPPSIKQLKWKFNPFFFLLIGGTGYVGLCAHDRFCSYIYRGLSCQGPR